MAHCGKELVYTKDKEEKQESSLLQIPSKNIQKAVNFILLEFRILHIFQKKMIVSELSECSES
jgi:hypothetical protein